MTPKEVAINFYEWLIDFVNADRESLEEDIDEMIEDFEKMYDVIPRIFNLLKDISDR